MRVLVCGGRDYAENLVVSATLDNLREMHRITTVIHGAAPGADTLAGDWAKANQIQVESFPVDPKDWKKHGKHAGPIRNQKMLDAKPDLVVAFPGGRGTADMVARAEKAKIKVLRVSSVKVVSLK